MTTETETAKEGESAIDCVLCDESSETIEDHNQHMEEIHDA